jgi:hypothetical protein
MKATLSILSFVVAFGLLVLFVRSQTRDEGIKYSKYYRATGSIYNGNSFYLNWGKYGLSLFRVSDSGSLKVPRDGSGSFGREYSMFGGNYKSWSGSHDNGPFWAMPAKTIWNSYGFWCYDQTWDSSDDPSLRQISRIGIPLWVPSVFFFLIGYTMFQSCRQGATQAEQRKAEQVVPSDGHKPSNHASSTNPTAPADAH